MKIAAIDIETLPDMEMVEFLPEPEASKVLKDPAKIEADLQKKREKQIEDMGLNPHMNTICCIGAYIVDTDGSEIQSYALLLEDEKAGSKRKLLQDFWELVKDIDHFVTFNGRGFDIRHIYTHNMRLQVRPSVQIDQGKYNKGNHTDVRLALNGDDPFGKGNLNYFAKIFLQDQKTEGLDGKLVNDLWQMGAYDEIKEYCLQDCKLTFRLFERAWSAGLINI